jgi:hypothetical protein|uniref:Uncharacterized protein n=1 Tax=viral metagenome TaxID=1070528 RepID=A0A6C0IXI0_9ZZZZ
MSSEKKEEHKDEHKEDLSLNKKIFKNIRITSQEHMLLNCIEQFYSDESNSEKLVDLVNGNISIRLIDFFVTNYSKKNRINYTIKDGESTSVFNVHSSYKSQLKAWNKKYFDPFSRGDRIPFFLENDCLITTIGQLNFFKWFINNNVTEYIETSIDKIEQDMNKNKKKVKKIQTVNKPKKNMREKIIKNYNMNTLSCMEPKKITKIEVTFD